MVRQMARRVEPTIDALYAGVLARDAAALGRAVTLIESTRESDEMRAQELLSRLLSRTGGAIRVGISGSPGAGKSTLIEALGLWLIGRGHRVAVLAVDPSSNRSHGSILGDKTRMTRLAVAAEAFIRPSPTGGALGGVARRTRETMLLCEAAGFDVVLVETVGVGQSETTVAEMTDAVLVITIAGAGDDLQGIKRGLFEVADVVAVNKADGANRVRAEATQSELQAALHLLRGSDEGGTPEVLGVSEVEGEGIGALWGAIEARVERARADGSFSRRRASQLRAWMWSMVDEAVLHRAHQHAAVVAAAPGLEAAVLAGTQTPTQAARVVLGLLAGGAAGGETTRS